MRRSKRMQMLKEEHAYVIVIVILLLLLAYSFYDKEFFFLITQFFTALHIPTSSYGKVIAFFAIAIAIFGFMLISKKLRLKLEPSFKKYLTAVTVLAIVVIAMSLMNSLIFLKYSNELYNDYYGKYGKFNQSYGNYSKELVITWISFEGESTHYFTIDLATHSHQSKSVIFYVLNSFGLTKTIAADIGEGAYAFQTQQEINLFLLISIAALISILYLVKNYIEILESKKGFFAKKIILIFALIVVLFHVVHALYDGGFFISFWVDSLVGLASITFLLKHYVTGKRRYLYAALFLLIATTYINSFIDWSLLKIFNIDALFADQGTALVARTYAFFVLTYLLSISLEYKKKELWMRDYLLPVIIAGVLFVPLQLKISNWTIYDAVTLHYTGGGYSYEGANTRILEVTTFENFQVPEDIKHIEFIVGDNGLKVIYLEINNRTPKHQVKKMFEDLNSPVISFNTTLRNYTHRFTVLYDNPVNDSRIAWKKRVGNMYLVQINGTFTAHSRALVAYQLGKETNNRAMIVEFRPKK